jgi:hypothetical protein
MKYREHRYPCDHPVRITGKGLARSAVVVNLSQHGARLARITDLAPGDRLHLAPRGGCPPCEAEVRWVRGSLAGLRFAEPLGPRTLAMMRKSGVARVTTSAPGSLWNTHLKELR